MIAWYIVWYICMVVWYGVVLEWWYWYCISDEINWLDIPMPPHHAQSDDHLFFIRETYKYSPFSRGNQHNKLGLSWTRDMEKLLRCLWQIFLPPAHAKQPSAEQTHNSLLQQVHLPGDHGDQEVKHSNFTQHRPHPQNSTWYTCQKYIVCIVCISATVILWLCLNTSHSSVSQ